MKKNLKIKKVVKKLKKPTKNVSKKAVKKFVKILKSRKKPKIKIEKVREEIDNAFSKEIKKKSANWKSKDIPPARIKVVGVGGAGGNAVSRMFEDFPRGVELIAINTDVQDLDHCYARKRVYIGKNLTKGLGTGMDPDIGRQAAEENRSDIVEAIKDADMIFITAGMGGGTGTGGAPVVAEIAKELGILTVGIVTKPFAFEGGQRARIAEEGLIKMRDRVDTLITIPNDRIFSIIHKDTSLMKAFEEVDKVLSDAVRGITELILTPGIINIDFADIKSIMRDAGSAMVGIGISSGQDRAIKAVELATHSPLLEISVDGARGLLFSISGRTDMKMQEINEIASAIAQSADPTAKIIFGTYHDRRLNKGQIKVTLIATGFSDTLSRDGRFISSLYVSDSELESKNSILPFDMENKSVESEDVNLDTEEQNIEEDMEKEWDIPAFLRRKKR
ncbi:cell division protein FtsZ [Candidatus Wolfebacteria bacterium CG10_big_fil_rev_8_21_14_0_10_31_9]|uniref:Cell division protein FtsZ n=1 Tax=Candidatus Wolfebacteria bacterium CG10_big_fil_rev_8_21_14_0_10_31_9 TaxID=1975070 RepID=A0A2H0RE57_9BACT|nr:MAG: cell division protein FtsZ [Candidatus Wolfebacteria bacterium CG10_big_fil_rev_8_21_14_0_10_31_9]